MGKKIVHLLFLLLLALVPAYFLSHLVPADGTIPAAMSIGSVETQIKSALPGNRRLAQLGLELRMLGGQKEQDGIVVTKDGLMRNIAPPDGDAIQANIAAMGAFSRQLAEVSGHKKHTYLAVIPTASGIFQQKLPQFSQSRMVNQQRLIEDLYSQLSDNVRSIDVYSALHSRREQYLYYRTENNLAALGGYYTYTAIARRLGVADRSLGQFDIEYVDYRYYGDLYHTPGGTGAPYREVAPDTLALFRYNRTGRKYTVTHRSGTRQQMYHSLYSPSAMELGASLDIYFGGMSAVMDIQSSSPAKTRLLVFGDKTAQAYLPFLAKDYQYITLVDLSQLTPADYDTIHLEEYDNALFVYSIETMIHTRYPSLAAQLVGEDATA